MLNNCTIMGRLTRDPELRQTQGGAVVCNFTIACDRERKDSDGTRKADFINCVAWRQTAEFVSKYFSKGRMICVVGSLQTRTYQDGNGNNRTATEVVCEKVSFTGEPRQTVTYQTSATQDGFVPGLVQDIEYNQDDLDDDLPF